MDRWSGEEKELACLGLIWSSCDRYCESVLQMQEHWSCCDSWRVNFPFQPLDLSLNKLFKDGVRKQWMADGIHEFTDSGRQKKASEELICWWISKVWKAILSEMITASLLKCGITNNLDGSQDELVYNSTENTSKTYLNWTASWNLRVLLFKDTEHFT